MAAINSLTAVVIVCHTPPTQLKANSKTKKNKKKKRILQPVAAVESMEKHELLIGTTVSSPISICTSTPKQADCAGNSNEEHVYCPLTLVKNVCQVSIVGQSEATEKDEVTTPERRQDVNTSCTSSSVLTSASEWGTSNVMPITYTDFCSSVSAVLDIMKSVARLSGSTIVSATSGVAPVVSVIDVVPAVSTGSQPVARNDIDDVALPHNESTVQQDRIGRALLSEPSISMISQSSASIYPPVATLQAQNNGLRPPDEADDPRLGRFNGAGLSNRQYKRHVIKLLAEKCPLPPPELIVTNRRLIRALPVSMAGQVRKWIRESSAR